MSAGEVRAFLARHGLAAHRDRGQNFLVDDQMADQLVELAGVEPGDSVIEVGTGLGILTRALARRGAKVVTIEVDGGVVRALREDAALPDAVELVHENALEVDLAALVARLPRPVRIVANLPYSVSAPLLRAFLDLRGEVEDWSLMLQQDLVDRLLASKNTKEYGSLSVLHLLTMSVERKRTLKPGCFYPVPNVDSAFVRFTPRTDSPLQEGELARLERLTRAAFASRRKTLINSLRGSGFEFEGSAKPAERLAEIGLDVRVRAEHVTPTQFLALSRSGGVAAFATPKSAAAAVTAPAVED